MTSLVLAKVLDTECEVGRAYDRLGQVAAKKASVLVSWKSVLQE